MLQLSVFAIPLLWSVDADWLHHQYATARILHRDSLHQVVVFHNPRALSSKIGAITKELLAALL